MQQVGLVMGAFALGLILCRPSLGKLADYRSRKLVVLIGMAVVAIAPLGYLVAKSIALLLLIRAFHGISIAAYTTGNSALIVDLSPVAKRGELIGYMSLTNPIGMALGPAMGGFLSEKFGYTPLFLLSCGLGLLGLLFAAQVQEPPTVEASLRKVQGTDTVSTPPPREQFWQLLGRPGLRIPTVILLLTGLVFGAVTTFVALYIREAGVEFNAGWFYTAAAISSFGIRLVTGRASDRYGRGLFITGSLVCYCVGMLLLAFAQTPMSFLLAGLVQGMGGGTLIPIIIALISDRSHPYERARVFALCVGGFDVGLAIAGPVFGAFAPNLGYQGIFALAAGLAVLALVIFVTQNSKNLSYSLRFATGRERDIYVLDQY